MSANGTAGTIFSPEKVTAPVGSMVQFQFMGGNHTVTQSSFAEPCAPLSAGNATAAGFHSDYVPAMDVAETGQVPAYTIMINDTAPIWAYCAQAAHCKGGMSMVINEK
ncbi:cupredoxin domain-containing protein [Candidatus Bathyarchaeota archaeon]|nr:cupredoxin domain-containing protein [Candidatus Bathyarchaeota archaeon]